MARKKPPAPTKAPAKKRTRSRSTKKGRPTECTPATTKIVVDAILNLATREDAARAAGVCRATLQRWLAEGAKSEAGPFRDFLDAVDAAESELVRFAGDGMKTLASHADTPPAVKFSAYKFILERKRPSEWGPKGAVQVSGPDGGAVRVEAQVEHTGEVAVALRPLVDRETLRELTRIENEAALSVELERQQQAETAEEGE